MLASLPGGENPSACRPVAETRAIARPRFPIRPALAETRTIARPRVPIRPPLAETRAIARPRSPIRPALAQIAANVRFIRRESYISCNLCHFPPYPSEKSHISCNFCHPQQKAPAETGAFDFSCCSAYSSAAPTRVVAAPTLPQRQLELLWRLFCRSASAGCCGAHSSATPTQVVAAPSRVAAHASFRHPASYRRRRSSQPCASARTPRS